MRTKPLVWAHRGASGYAPENTLAAFQKAVDLGADGVELDIQLTKDDQIVVIHDEMIDRTSDGKGWVKDYTLEELRAFNYNRTKPEYKHADIPTMREVFELLKPTGLFINIEIKTGVVFYEKIEEKILALAKEMGMEDRVCYSSFNHYTVTRIHELKPDAEVGFLYADGPIDMPSYGVKHGVNALHPALYNLQYDGFVKECKEKGLKLNVWTVNERPYMEMCCQYGVDAIITNYPDIAKEVVG
ncbi:glycerophosphodiester phosphodiesterase [Roseburia sp. AM16-25]|uniref:glycerophosphodiester phosphodiesterase n=1 Tax=Roseburia sp. AM16-25 TaxID=2292065 RepID=UPI000E540323|nr:glycerophosphodiester phosphodiesterase [Roseburia sp. AM16-25]RHO30863.1 glycerophosphodiester phosphodiesterase [Roseburia sp. AM16-25]